MNLSATSFILLVSSINGLLFCCIALTKARKERGGYYIPLLLLLCSLLLFDEFTRWTPDFFQQYAALAYFPTFAWFLVIPVVYLLVRQQMGRGALQWPDLLHLLLPVLSQLASNSAVLLSPEVKATLLEHYYMEPEPHYAKLIFAAQILIYLSLIYRLLKQKYKFSGWALFIRMNYWLKAIYLLLLSYFAAIALIIFSLEVYDIHLRWLDIGKTFTFLFIIYGWLLFVINKPAALKYPLRSMRVWADRFELDGLSPKLSRLVNKMRSEKLYLQKDLKLDRLAQALNVSGRRLTDMVNQELGLSIPQLINLLRVKELEKRYQSGAYANYSLLGLAESVGFSSKSSFYRSFGQFTGETPATYLKKLPGQTPEKMQPYRK